MNNLIIERIAHLEELVSSMAIELSALKELVKVDAKVSKKVYIMPSVVKRFTDDGRELLPPPPKVIYVDVEDEEDKKAQKLNEKLGCKLITELPDFYRGKCTHLEVQISYKDYGKKELYRNKNYIVFRAYNKLKLLGTIELNKDSKVCRKWYPMFKYLGIEKVLHSEDPHLNGMPGVVNFFV